MPYLKIQTNCPVENEKSKNLLASVSKTLASELGKPERYVMVELTSNSAMLFGGSDEPLAYLELKSIGLPSGKVSDLSRVLSSLLQNSLNISPSRVYIEFTDAKGSFWGWNGSTF